MGEAASTYRQKRDTHSEELRLRLPLRQPDGSLKYVDQSIDRFPYYLRTNDFSDYYRLALVQREMAVAEDWLEFQEFYKGAHFEHQPLTTEEEILVQRAFTMQIRRLAEGRR
jgi:hypothetical protein